MHRVERWVANWRGELLTVIAGLMLPLAFAPFSLAPLALVSLLILLLVWRTVSPRRAFWRGYLYGLAMFGLGVSWVHVSMHRFGGVSIPLSVALTILFVAFLALFPALLGWLSRRWAGPDQPAHFLLVLVPTLWTAGEWIRGLIFTGFPWLSLGYSQIDWPLAQWAPLFGVFAVSWLLALSAGLIFYASLNGSWRRSLAALAVIWLTPALLAQVEWSEPVDGPINVSMIQGNMSQDQKWRAEQLLPTLRMYAELSRQNWGDELIIWPETAVPALYHQVKPFLAQLAQEARMNSSELLLGIPIYDQKEKVYYNAMISLGLAENSYEKQHLVPFGEYLPLPSLLGGIIDFFDIPMSDFTSGNAGRPPVIEVAGQKIGISICYEDVFGEEVIEALPQATLLVNASNDAWFGDSVAPHQHMEIARMRALETARFMLRSTNTGVSAVIDHRGEVVATSPQFEVHVLRAEVQPRTGMTPYAVFGNAPLVICILAVLAIFFYRRKSA